MMRPQRRAFMPGNVRRRRRTAPSNFSSRSSFHNSSVMSMNGMAREVPALLTTISTGPKAVSTAPCMALMASPSRISQAWAEIRAPGTAASISALASSSTSPRRATMATWAPELANSRAMALPRPRLPPVIRAVRPSILHSMMVSPWHVF